jgi:Osmosensitive K+ channel histidine kinase
LINLLENAIKHSPDDSTIDVSVKKEGPEAVFEVADNGTGIAVEAMPHLFEHYTVKENQSPDSSRGMGIGLSICMSIIKAHHGGMEAVNKPEGGAIFRFSLPLKEDRENAG